MIASLASAASHGIEAHAFGIDGLTPGAVGIILTMIGLSSIWFIRGAAERRRASNEGVTALSGANDLLFKNLTAEVARLTKMVAEQGKRISAQDKHIMVQDKRISELEKELHEARAVVDEVRKNELGAIRNAAQTDLATVAMLNKQSAK
jgi:hypothetical protein